ncbi:MAG: tyrosine-type recombinase/integrase [Oscillospiraceae bacterium]|jgi:site-specific recombinase XerD|nr:tyrosine-type recombinase/integrase [Oscillospiraceae bacterium]
MREEELRELPGVAQQYLLYLRAVRGRSPLTVLEYASDLRTFFRWLAREERLVPPDTPWEQIGLHTLTAETLSRVELYKVYEYISFCADVRGNSARTRKRKVVALRRFYRFLETEKIIKQNPLEHLEAPEGKSGLPKYLTVAQCQELLASIDGNHAARNYAIITLFLHCGLRLAELVGINLRDLRENELCVLGKGNKQRLVYLNDACLDALGAYLPVRAAALEAQEAAHAAQIRRAHAKGIEMDESLPKSPDALFLSNRKTRISRRMVEAVVYKFLEKAGLDAPGMSTHKLRHSAATMYYQHGVDIVVIKEMLGHENLSTTQIYTHVSNSQLRDAAEHNPLLQ